MYVYIDMDMYICLYTYIYILTQNPWMVPFKASLASACRASTVSVVSYGAALSACERQNAWEQVGKMTIENMYPCWLVVTGT